CIPVVRCAAVARDEGLLADDLCGRAGVVRGWEELGQYVGDSFGRAVVPRHADVVGGPELNRELNPGGEPATVVIARDLRERAAGTGVRRDDGIKRRPAGADAHRAGALAEDPEPDVVSGTGYATGGPLGGRPEVGLAGGYAGDQGDRIEAAVIDRRREGA